MLRRRLRRRVVSERGSRVGWAAVEVGVVRLMVSRSALVGALCGLVVAAPATAEKVSEFSLAPNTFPGGMVAGADGALWFTSFASPDNEIGRITTQGGVADFPLPAGRQPFAIAAGRDGALWFTEGVPSAIGRIATTGALSEFPLRTGGVPEGVVAGRDGALWFAVVRPGAIGRITTGGALKTFPARVIEPAGIAAGPDGALWFTGANAIGRITTRGTVTEFALRGDRFANAIAAGPDGALWFTEDAPVGGKDVAKVGRITPAGKIREFPVASAPSDVFGITAGADGALWFTEEECVTEDQGTELAEICKGANVGRITTDGRVSLHPLASPDAHPTAIAPGPDGALWFSARAKIGRIVPPAAPRLSLKVDPRTGCASTSVKARVKVTGGAKLTRVDLSLNGRRLLRTMERRFGLRVPVRSLAAGTHTLEGVAVDRRGSRTYVSRTFRRC